MKKERISEALSNICDRHIEEAENYSAAKKSYKKILGRAEIGAAAVICIASVSVCAFANPIGGFFRNIFRFDGAIVGTSYENASDEINIKVKNAANETGKTGLTLEITLLEMDGKEPYIYLKNGSVSIGDYRILDASGNQVCSAKGQQKISGAIEDGKAVLKMEVGETALLSGERYTIVIESVYGLQKAEQPLEMCGYWECEFAVD